MLAQCNLTRWTAYQRDDRRELQKHTALKIYILIVTSRYDKFRASTSSDLYPLNVAVLTLLRLKTKPLSLKYRIAELSSYLNSKSCFILM